MKKKILQVLTSLRFAIFLLLVIAFISGIGSVIEQDQSLDYYQQYYSLQQPIFGFLSYPWIFAFELHHVYKSWVFLLLICCLGVSLMCCTFTQQLPMVKIARQCSFLRNLSLLDVQASLPKKKGLSEKSLLFLKSRQFYTHQQKSLLYASKGLFGKIGPILVHFSLVCILLGAISGAFGRFNAQEFVPKGEILHMQNILGTGWLSHFPSYSFRLNDFWIEYQNQKIGQFYSDLSILNNVGKEIFQQTISVNKPLIYQRIYFYQIDWNFLGIQIQQQNDATYQYPLTLLSESPKIWASWLFNERGSQGRILVLDEIKQVIKLYDNLGNFLTLVNFNETFVMDNQVYRLMDLIPETGLQVKYDPSIFLTYTGFAALMFSTLLSYLTYSQIWMALRGQRIFLGGKTTRSKSSFEVEFQTFFHGL